MAPVAALCEFITENCKSSLMDFLTSFENVAQVTHINFIRTKITAFNVP